MKKTWNNHCFDCAEFDLGQDLLPQWAIERRRQNLFGKDFGFTGELATPAIEELKVIGAVSSCERCVPNNWGENRDPKLETRLKNM
jgi:hypothetical protein